MEMNKDREVVLMDGTDTATDPSRRRFLQIAGGFAGVGLLVASCRRTPASDTYVGAGDVALLNYLYILKQVTVAFWAQAVTTPYQTISAIDNLQQMDLRDQEVTHREFFKKLLGNDAVKDIVTELSAVTFIDKTSFLTHAAILEDLSVAAYNGVIKVMKNNAHIVALSKIASVDARHASYVNNALHPNDVGNIPGALNPVVAPVTGMTTLQKYIQTKFDISKLPTF